MTLDIEKLKERIAAFIGERLDREIVQGSVSVTVIDDDGVNYL